MKKRREPSFALLSLAVVVPLLALAVLAWLGIRSQIEFANMAARKVGQTVAEVMVSNITTSLEQRLRPVPVFSDPPRPGPTPPENDPLDGSDVGALMNVRDNNPGLSPGGLPRQVLAAMRIVEITRNEGDAAEAIRLATLISPSALTSKVLDRVNEIFPGLANPALAEWRLAQEARALILVGTELDRRGGWHGTFFLEKSSNGPRFIHESDLAPSIGQAMKTANFPSSLDLRVSVAGRVVTGSGSGAIEERQTGRFITYGFGDRPLATMPIPFGERMQLDILPKDNAAYESLIRGQITGAIVVLAAALAAAVLGLWFMHRLVARERRLNAMKSDFVAGVSHELRAPMASIRLMADALEGGKIEERTAGEFHRLISREGARLSTLIENVLDFARIEQGRKQWHLEETDLPALVHATVALMEPLAREKRIALAMESLPEAANARIDPGAIQQALVNLLDNAIKFSPPDSIVGIRLSKSDAGAWKISIADQGPGIPRAEHSRIFEKFHRLGSELRRETQGTGIGLSLVKAIAEAHEGSIHPESEPGHGSTFTLTLPAT